LCGRQLMRKTIKMYEIMMPKKTISRLRPTANVWIQLI